MVSNDKQTAKGFEKYAVAGAYQNPTRNGAVTADHVLKKVRYMFSNYVRGVDGIKYTSRGDFENLRLYAAGRQAEEKYHPYFFGSSQTAGNTFNNSGVDVGGVTEQKFDSKEWARKALGHINWKIMSPMPKIMNKVLSSFYGNSYDINIECVDENSISEQENNKWLAWVESQEEYIAFMQQVSAQVGVSFTPPNKKIGTIDELELMEANGGFKLNYAKEGEKIIKDAWNISNEEELDEKIIKDIVTLNVGAYRVYYDREVGKEMFRYIDPVYSGIQYSRHNDFRDSSYAYELTFIPAYKLQSYGIDITQVPSIAQRYAGQYGNPEWEDSYSSLGTAGAELNCGFFTVPVLDIEWIDVDTEKKVKFANKYGQERVREYEPGENTAGKQYIETKLPRIYQAKWVVDTDFIYEWGLKPNQPKKEKNQSLLSFHFIKGKTEQSLVEQLVPVLDNFQLNWLKLQDAIASSVKSGYAIEFEALQGLRMGGGKLDPLDMLAIHRVTGNMYYTRKSRHTNATTSKPIEPLQNGIGTAIADFINALDIDAKLMEEITGINPVSLGSTADPRAGKAVTEMAVSSSGSPIKNTFDKTFQLKAHASLDLLQRVQLDLKNSPTVRKRYAAVVGELGVQTMVLAEGKGVSFGTKLVARPRQEDIASIKNYIAIALQSGKNGQPGLSIPEAMYVERRLSEGANLVEIEQYVRFQIKKAEEQQQAYAQQAAQQQGTMQQQYEQLKAENQRILAQMQVEATNAINAGKFYYDAQLSYINSENKMREIMTQAGTFTPPLQMPMGQPPVQPDTTIDGKSAEQLAAEQQQAMQQQQGAPEQQMQPPQPQMGA